MSVRKPALMLVFVNVFQFLLGSFLLAGLFAGLFDYSTQFAKLSLCLVLLCSVLSAVSLFPLRMYERNSYRESMRNLEQLNLRLRAQRHDYLNHMQVVYGLLELGEHEAAAEYLRPVFKDIMKVSLALRTAEPAVNALLQAKMEAAERQGIDFYLEVATQLAQLEMESWEFCKILSNLIDNAATAVLQRKGEKKITVRLEEGEGEYLIMVRNNGPEITLSQQKLIFRQGYTTKKEEGHGMGLVIVSSVLDKAGGRIWLESGREETTFWFTVPQNVRSEKKLRPLRRFRGGS